jgi:hypothetical protein
LDNKAVNPVEIGASREDTGCWLSHMFAVHHDLVGGNDPAAIRELAARCVLLCWWFCALLIASDKGGLRQAATSVSASARRCALGLPTNDGRFRFPTP